MKSFKSILTVVALFAIGSMNAKQTGARTTLPSSGGIKPMPSNLTVNQFITQITNMEKTIKSDLNSVSNLIQSVKQSSLSNSDKRLIFNSGNDVMNNLKHPVDQARQKFAAAYQDVEEPIEQTQIQRPQITDTGSQRSFSVK